MEQTGPAFYKIFAADLERASGFYRLGLGFTEKRRIDAGGFAEVILTPSVAGAALSCAAGKMDESSNWAMRTDRSDSMS